MSSNAAHLIGLVAQSALSLFGIRSAYEQPHHRLVGRRGAVEIRDYAPRVAAEVTLPDGPGARDEAFRLLAGYIFGRNRGRRGAERMAMTTPVETEPERIAMTAPVEAGSGAQGLTMRFFLPRSLEAGSAPAPLDERVRVVEVPRETLAVLRFAGPASREAQRRQGEALLRMLEGSAWRPVGSPVFMGYDPPFTPPPLRRNEMAVRVERR
jgi:hypothetical protein